MTRQQLEQQREGVQAQMRWAVRHGGDHELLDLLRVENDRLFAMMGQHPTTARPGHQARSSAQPQFIPTVHSWSDRPATAANS
jgi:hypothetical protein